MKEAFSFEESFLKTYSVADILFWLMFWYNIYTIFIYFYLYIKYITYPGYLKRMQVKRYDKNFEEYVKIKNLNIDFEAMFSLVNVT